MNLVRIAIMVVLVGIGYGCVRMPTHYDYLSTFYVAGLVKTSKEKVTNSRNTIFIVIYDISLDDERRIDQRQILLTTIKNGEVFSLKQTYFWGSSIEDPYESGMVVVVVSAEGCQKWDQEYNVSKLLDENNDFRIALGEIQLNCT